MTDRELLENILIEIKNTNTELSNIKSDVKNMNTELSNVKSDVKNIKTQQQEDHLILKALEHSSQVNKAEHDFMKNSIAHIEGHEKSIDENLDAIKLIIGNHDVDIRILKSRPV